MKATYSIIKQIGRYFLAKDYITGGYFLGKRSGGCYVVLFSFGKRNIT